MIALPTPHDEIQPALNGCPGDARGLSAQAHDINEAGEIVGVAMTSAPRSHAFLWRDGSMTDLGTVGGNHSEAVAASDTGHIAGRSQNPATRYHATLWSGGATTDLTPTSDYAVAYGVNDIAEVVGAIDNWKGFHWRNGVLTMLGDLGGGCSHANDINDTGHIVGTSCPPTPTRVRSLRSIAMAGRRRLSLR